MRCWYCHYSPFLLHAVCTTVKAGVDWYALSPSLALTRLRLRSEARFLSRFRYLCDRESLDPIATFQQLVLQYVPGGVLNPPFNDAERLKAGMSTEWYHCLARQQPTATLPVRRNWAKQSHNAAAPEAP